MGYTTDFEGRLEFDKPLTTEQREYINLLSSTRRMKRDVGKLMKLYKGEFGNPFALPRTPETIYGHDGEYFAKDDGNSGQTEDESIIDYNCPPGQQKYDSTADFSARWEENKRLTLEGKCQPGLWCQWVIDSDGYALQWDGNEKFYNYIEWLKYLINHFFEPWGVKLNGVIEWEGEDSNDKGKIIVNDNVVKIKKAIITYIDED